MKVEYPVNEISRLVGHTAATLSLGLRPPEMNHL